MSDQHRMRIEQRAYELWEREGRPDGRHDQHWAEAERQIAAETSGAGDAAAALAGHSADASSASAVQPKAKPPAAQPAVRKAAAAR